MYEYACVSTCMQMHVSDAPLPVAQAPLLQFPVGPYTPTTLYRNRYMCNRIASIPVPVQARRTLTTVNGRAAPSRPQHKPQAVRHSERSSSWLEVPRLPPLRPEPLVLADGSPHTRRPAPPCRSPAPVPPGCPPSNPVPVGSSFRDRSRSTFSAASAGSDDPTVVAAGPAGRGRGDAARRFFCRPP